MWTIQAANYKGCPTTALLGNLVPSSPSGICSSSGAFSVSRASSADCSSLFGMETVGDIVVEDDGILAYCAPGPLNGAAIQSEKLAAEISRARSLYSHIRDDLRKQQEARAARSSYVKGLCATPRRLPASYRGRMVGWMCEVSDVLGLHSSTLFAAVSILDRFVASFEALPSESLLQLLALACMSVAVKFNEVGQVPPALWLSLAVDMCGKLLYGAEDLQRCEWTVLQAIGWRLHEPNIYSFLAQFLMCLPSGSLEPAELLANGHAHGLDISGTCGADGNLNVTHPESFKGMVDNCPPAASSLAQWPLTSRALSLAGACLMYEDIILSYEPSAVALACMAVAERMMLRNAATGTAAAPGAPLGPTWQSGSGAGGLAAAASAIESIVGVKLDQLAPRWLSCAETLNGLVTSPEAITSPQRRVLPA